MAKLYIGDSQGTPAIIKIEEIPKKKFGVSIDNLLGNVDENGNYTAPTESFVLDLTGVKFIPKVASLPSGTGFYHTLDSNMQCVGVIGNDLVGSDQRGALAGICSTNTKLRAFEFNSLETITAQEMFQSCNTYGYSGLVPHFRKLKRIESNSKTFESAFNSAKIEPDETFPLLEYVSGSTQFGYFRSFSNGDEIIFSKIKTIVGDTSKYDGTFGSLYYSTIWKFPSATEFTNYIWNISASYPGELHFAAANQAAIEACEGYSYKWGFAGATIYFDLMLSITVNGVVYSREYTIGGYTSWKDASDNIVYTDATAEPAVGTPVYSDQGTTQVGTVSEVA